MRYILVTGGNLRNKGAQAMTFIAVDEISRRFPGREIVVISDPDAVKEHPEFRFLIRDSVCLYGRGYKLLQHRYGKLDRYGDAAKIRKNIEAVVDISGYTFASHWGWAANLLAAYRARQAARFGAPIYFMPQSFGPFVWKSLPGKLTDRFLRRWLSLAQVLYAREREGEELLKGHYGLTNVRRSVDLVLQNRGIDLNRIYKQPPELRVPEIAAGSVAVLPNIRTGRYGTKQELLDAYQRMIRLLLKNGRTVCLIRHSVEDLAFCREIKALFNEEKRVLLFENDFSCLEYEAFVKQFDYLIASRYHAIVHAYRQGIPCVVLGWAIKYQELLKEFGQEAYAVDVRTGLHTDQLEELIVRMEQNREREAEQIRTHLPELQRENVFNCLMTDADVSATVREGLCTACGICAAVCPARCIHSERKNGLFVPVIDRTRCLACGKCLRVCPGYHYDYEAARQETQKTLADENRQEPPVCYTVQANDKEILAGATSGGLITALVCELLNNGSYKTAFLVEGYVYDRQMKTTAVRAGDSLSATQKSRYLPVSQEDAAAYILEHPGEKIIYVGTGCAVHGLCNALREAGRDRENLLIVGLFCDQTMQYGLYDYFKHRYSRNKALTAFHFRDKRAGGWPGNLRLEFDDGTHLHLSAKERMIVKDFFRLRRCLYCYDKLNEAADLSIGDNYTGKDAPREGTGSLLVRTKAGEEALEQCRHALLLKPSSYESVRRGQKLAEREHQRRNNRIYAKQHGERPVESGLPEDLRQILADGKEPGRKDARVLQKQLEEAALGERGEFHAIERRKTTKRLKLYWQAFVLRFLKKGSGR